MRLAFVLALVLVACSDDDVSEPPPTACAQTQRSGTYLFAATEQSGSCGALEGGLVALDPAAPPAEGCTVDRDVWSEADCKLERTMTCTGSYATPAQWGGRGGYLITGVAVTRQMTADGSRVEGTMTVSIETTGGSTCRSTYAASWTRQ